MDENVTDITEGNIVLSNTDLNNFAFQQALSKLKTVPFGAKMAYKISYITDHIERHVKQGREIFSNIAKKFAKLDENGNLIPEMKDDKPIPGSFVFLDDEAGENFMKEQVEFMSIEHTIPKHKLTVAELGDAKFAANEISALAPLFSDLD